MSITLPTNWEDNVGMVENAAFLNNVGTQVNANTAAIAAVALPQSGNFSSMPAAAPGNAGEFYFCTDAGGAVFKSTGTAWVKVAIGEPGGPVGDVPTTGWTGVNMQSGWTWASDLDSMLFTAASTSGSPMGYQYRPYPSPPFTLTIHLNTILETFPPAAASGDFFIGGIVISDGTLASQFGPLWGNVSPGGIWDGAGLYLGNWHWASGLGSASQPAQTFLGSQWNVKPPSWYRFVDDGTNRSMQVSLNGFDWLTFVSESRTSYLTPTRIGIGVANDAGVAGVLRIRSWYGVS